MAHQNLAVHLANQKTDKHGRSQTVTRSAGVPYSGDANAGNIGVGAEIYLGDQGWVDISSDIYYRDGSTQVQISRGRPNESASSLPPPQSCTFQLNNRLNKYSPRNPLGQYYGLIGRNTPIRFWRMQNGVRRYRYAGEIPSWPTTADISGNDVYTSVQASGLLRRLSQGTPPVQSAMYRSMVNPLRIGEGNVVAYWPLEDGSSATQFASGLPSGAAMQVARAGVTPSSNSSWQASKALPVMGTGSLAGSVTSYTATGQTNFRLQLIVPSGGIASPVDIITFYGTGTITRWVFALDSLGEIALAGYDTSGNAVLATGFGAPMPTGLNGKNVTLGLTLQQSGTDVLWTVYTQDVGASSYATGVSEFDDSNPGVIHGYTVGRITNVILGDDKGGNLGQLAIGHCAIGNQLSAFDATDLALIAASGEPVFSPDALTAGNQNVGRFLRLCQEQNINGIEQYGTVYSGDVITMGAQLPDTFVNWLQQCADSGLNLLFETRDQVAMALRSRLSLYNQSAKLTLNYSQNQLAAQLQPQDDDAFTRNDVTVTRTNGSSSRQVLNDGSALSVSNPPTGSGDYSTSVSLSLGADTQTNDQAGWRVHMGTVDEPRYPRVSINLRHETFQNNLDLMNAALTLDIGDVIEIDNPPTWISYDPIRLVVLGYQETMGAFEHNITFNCAPESPYRIAVLEDWVLSRADLDGSTLASPLAASDTLISLATDPTGPLWTMQPQDFPFDLKISGERVTVISPGTSLAKDPYLASGLTHFNGQGGSISLDGTRPFPTNADNILKPFALQTILMVPTGGTTSDVLTDNSGPSTVVVGNSYTAWGWVYNPNGRNMKCFINWADNSGTYLSTSFGMDTSMSSGVWTLVTVVATAPTSTGQLSVGVVDSGTPTSAQTYNCWGLNATATSNLTQTSPQSFTVVRAINGVSKAQNAGASVKLWQPMILSL